VKSRSDISRIKGLWGAEMMRLTAVVVVLGLGMGGLCLAVDPPRRQQGAGAEPAASRGEAERPEDTKAIHQLGQAFAEAFNKGDAQAIANLFTEDSEITSTDGTVVHGRKAIGESFAAGFKETPGEKLEVASESIRFFGNEIARESGRSRTTHADGSTPEWTRYVALLVKKDGKWLHLAVQETPDQTLSAHDRLKELEWMVGDWIDEGDDGVVRTSCRWSDDRSYLLRDFVIQIAGQRGLSGSQRIGWDPLTGQFKSWVFDPDGGHSEGTWTRNGKNQWIIRASGVLGDGRTVVGTQILTFVNKDQLRWASVNRAVGGEAIPDLDEIVIVRTPPKAKAKAAPAAPK
jgi:uncharacterized protein (TIGR02246 family)